FTSMTKA
ncbi:Late transcription factor VLTF-4 (1), partial [Monkeypox virus]